MKKGDVVGHEFMGMLFCICINWIYRAVEIDSKSLVFLQASLKTWAQR